MRIMIDVTVLTLATFVTGIQRVTREYTTRLVMDDTVDTVLLHYNSSEDKYHIVDNNKFVAFYVNHHGKKEKMITNKVIELSDICEGDIFFDIDATWMCRMKRSYLLPILHRQGVKIVTQVYDIISVNYPQYCLERGVYNFMDYITAHLLYDDEIIVNAQATKTQIEELCAKLNIKCPNITIIPLGADYSNIKKAEKDKVPEQVQKACEKPFVLMVGTLEPRKNHKMLLNAYDYRLKEMGYSIVMAGYMGWDMEDFKKRLENHPDYQNGVYHFEGLDDNTISYLYENAECLAFLSYTEGYGLPIVEALSRGVAVVASDVDVYHEVGGDNCVWVEQDDFKKLCFLINENNIVKRQDNIKYSYSHTWNECYEKLKRKITGR